MVSLKCDILIEKNEINIFKIFISNLSNNDSKLENEINSYLELFNVLLNDYFTKTKCFQDTKYKELIDNIKLEYDDKFNKISQELLLKNNEINIINNSFNSISENIKKMGIPFEVKLDETFSAEIKQFGTSIETDSLSTGENKRVNIAILIAYLKLIRTKKFINILFLDEVFAGIDIKGVDDILILFKKFANERNINVILVHHSELKDWFFDKII